MCLLRGTDWVVEWRFSHRPASAEARVLSQVSPCVLVAIKATLVQVSLSVLPFSPVSTIPQCTCCFHQKEKWTKPGNLPEEMLFQHSDSLPPTCQYIHCSWDLNFEPSGPCELPSKPIVFWYVSGVNAKTCYVLCTVQSFRFCGPCSTTAFFTVSALWTPNVTVYDLYKQMHNIYIYTQNKTILPTNAPFIKT